MSLTEFNVVVEKKDLVVTVQPPRSAIIEIPTTPDVLILASGNIGPPGPAGKWEAITQNEYDLLNPPDPDTLYIIIQ